MIGNFYEIQYMLIWKLFIIDLIPFILQRNWDISLRKMPTTSVLMDLDNIEKYG